VPQSSQAFSHIRARTGKLPHVYFGWTEGSPATYLRADGTAGGRDGL